MSATALTLTQMRERRTTLEGEFAEAQSALDGARAGLVVGSSTAKQVVSAQNLADALEGALTALDAQIHDAAELEAEERAEAYRQGLTADLIAAAQRATAHRQACTDKLETAIADLGPKLEDAFAELYELSALRTAWARTLKELDRALPTPGSALPLLEAQADLRAIRAKALPGDWHENLTTDSVYSVIFGLPAEQHLLWRLYLELKQQGKLEGAVHT